MDCSLCDNAIPPPQVTPYSYNGEGVIVTGLVGTFSVGSRRNHEIYLSALGAFYFYFLLCTVITNIRKVMVYSTRIYPYYILLILLRNSGPA